MKTWSITLPSMKGITPFDPFEPPELPLRPRPHQSPLPTACRSLRRPRETRARRHGRRHPKAADGDDPPPLGRFQLGTPSARITTEARP